MNKKVLLVESSDAIRTVGENILRQNGYEVIGISDSERALEVVDYAQPDLLIIAADLNEKSGRPFYERAQSEPSLNQVPILLLINEDEEKPALPPKSLLEKPFDPKDFMGRVQNLLSSHDSPGSGKPTNPLNQADLDDDFLDAALGLDGLDVVESEVMDKTTHKRKSAKRQPQEKMLGLDHDVDDEEMADSGRVESLMIRDENSSDIDRQQEKNKKVEDLTASSKLEILDDQFGIQDLNAGSALGGQQQGDHDYHWFVNEMQKEGQPKSTTDNAGELSFEDPSTKIDPITPNPTSETSKAKNSQEVEKFIDEFKKEVERFDEIDDDLVPGTATASSKSDGSSKMDWEDTIENLTPDKVALFTRQLAYDLAEKLAIRIAAKIDPEKLLSLIKAEVIARAQQEKNKINRP